MRNKVKDGVLFPNEIEHRQG